MSTVTGYQSMISWLHREAKMDNPLRLVNSDYTCGYKIKVAQMKQNGEMKAEEAQYSTEL